MKKQKKGRNRQFLEDIMHGRQQTGLSKIKNTHWRYQNKTITEI